MKVIGELIHAGSWDMSDGLGVCAAACSSSQPCRWAVRRSNARFRGGALGFHSYGLGSRVGGNYDV